MQLIACTRTYADEILAILNEAIRDSTALYDYRPRTSAMMQSWFDAKEQGSWPVIGAVDESGRLLGFGTYGPFRAWAAYKYTVEHSIYVERTQRGRGVGRRLLAELIASARRQQLHVLIGGIDADNAASIALHRSLGFERCAHLPQVGFKFNRWLDLELYQLVLETPARPVEG